MSTEAQKISIPPTLQALGFALFEQLLEKSTPLYYTTLIQGQLFPTPSNPPNSSLFTYFGFRELDQISWVVNMKHVIYNICSKIHEIRNRYKEEELKELERYIADNSYTEYLGYMIRGLLYEYGQRDMGIEQIDRLISQMAVNNLSKYELITWISHILHMKITLTLHTGENMNTLNTPNTPNTPKTPKTPKTPYMPYKITSTPQYIHLFPTPINILNLMDSSGQGESILLYRKNEILALSGTPNSIKLITWGEIRSLEYLTEKEKEYLTNTANTVSSLLLTPPAQVPLNPERTNLLSLLSQSICMMSMDNRCQGREKMKELKYNIESMCAQYRDREFLTGSTLPQWTPSDSALMDGIQRTIDIELNRTEIEEEFFTPKQTPFGSADKTRSQHQASPSKYIHTNNPSPVIQSPNIPSYREVPTQLLAPFHAPLLRPITQNENGIRAPAPGEIIDDRDLIVPDQNPLLNTNTLDMPIFSKQPIITDTHMQNKENTVAAIHNQKICIFCGENCRDPITPDDCDCYACTQCVEK